MLPCIEQAELSENLINESNLAIIGSRTFNNYSYAKKEILNIIQNNKISMLYSKKSVVIYYFKNN